MATNVSLVKSTTSGYPQQMEKERKDLFDSVLRDKAVHPFTYAAYHAYLKQKVTKI
jgi:hypothetical protein